MQSSIPVTAYRLQSQMRKSPSSAFESSHFSRSISFKDDYDVEGVCDQRSDNLSLASSITVTTDGAITSTTPVIATAGTAPDSAIGKHTVNI